MAKNIEKSLYFNISEIMADTDDYVVGSRISEYYSVWVATFHHNKKAYDLYTIYDLDTNYSELVVVYNGKIINKI